MATNEEIQKGIEATEAKVERYLKKMGTYQVLEGGFYRIQEGSAQVLIRVLSFSNGQPFVRVLSPVLREVKKAGNEAMFEEFSQLNNNWIIGKIYWAQKEDTPGFGFVMIEHCLLGAFLDYEELLASIQCLAIVADEFDDKLKAKFGGKRFID